MKKYGKTQLGKIAGKTDAKDRWKAVRRLTGEHHDAAAVDGRHRQIAQRPVGVFPRDPSCIPPLSEISAKAIDTQCISE